MATVIDALVMTLGLDTRDYDRGQKTVDAGLDKTKKHADAVAKEMYEGGKKAASFFGSIKAELISLLAVAVAGKGLSSFLQDSIGGMAKLGREASNLSMSAKTLDAWGAAAETVGGSVDGITGSLKGFAAGLEEFKATGASPMVGVLRSLGVAVTDSRGKLIPYSQDLFAIADKFKTMGAQDALFYGKKLGFDEGTIQLLRQGGPAVKSLVEQMSRLSGVTDAGVESAQRNQAEWAKIRMHFKGIRETISSDLDPALEKLANRVLTWMDANHKLIATKIAEWLNKLVDFLPKLVDGVNDIAEAMGGWKTVLIALLGLKVLGWIASFGSGLRLLIPLITSATGGMLALAAAAGALAGTGLYKTIEGTPVADFIGKTVALGMAALGSKDAQDAMDADDFSKLPEHIQQTILKARASAAAGAGTSSNSNAQHSQAYSTNAELFDSLEKRAGLPSGVLQKMFMRESGGGKNLTSPVGAQGPFQFMPDTAASLGLKGDQVNDLDASAAAAAVYLAKLRAMFGGDMTRAVAAYNAGPGNVRKYGGVPPFAETKAYVASIMGGSSPGARSSRMGAASSSTSTSETKINQLIVQTAATDSKGIVRDMRQELSRNQLIAAGNRGAG